MILFIRGAAYVNIFIWIYKEAAFSNIYAFSYNSAASINYFIFSQTTAISITIALSASSFAIVKPLLISPCLIDVLAIPAKHYKLCLSIFSFSEGLSSYYKMAFSYNFLASLLFP